MNSLYYHLPHQAINLRGFMFKAQPFEHPGCL